jgi:hypothetical protein
MNYQQSAAFDNSMPYYGREGERFTDNGNGIPIINSNSITTEDIYRTPFLFLQDHRKNYKNMSQEALPGIQSQSELSKLFFSDENFKRIQKGIKAEVYKRTNGTFRLDVDQEQRDLFILMRAVYMQNARFLPGEIVRQVKRLNQKVITDSVPDIITGIKQEYGYLKEINKPLDPIPRPINVNNRGRRTLPCVCTTFGA